MKWIGIVLGSLIALILLVALGLTAKSRLEFSANCAVQVGSVAVPTDPASIAYAQHLAAILCMECHGKVLGGELGWFKGGLGSPFSDADFVRASHAHEA